MQIFNLYPKKKKKESLSMRMSACSKASNIRREFLKYFLNFTFMLKIGRASCRERVCLAV